VTSERLAVVVLISGRGSNLQAIIDAAGDSDCPFTVSAVISNQPGAAGLERARRAGIPVEVVDHRTHAHREAFDAALAEVIDGYRPGLVVLAGFMRILTPAFVARYAGRLINIHPSLLPEFPGLDTHARAIAAGAAEHGASVHFVTAALDGGPLIIQARVPVRAGDDADTLAARVLEQEHRILPEAIRWFAAGRLQMEDSRVLLDGEPAL
jgi:phosphoribosylglycinamide formyltransferase-1